MNMNLEDIIIRLENKVNELTFRSKELERLEATKDRLETTYKCELRKELLCLLVKDTRVDNIVEGGRGNVKIAQLRISRDLAILRYYSTKSLVQNIKREIEFLRSMLIYLREEFQGLKVKRKRYPWLN